MKRNISLTILIFQLITCQAQYQLSTNKEYFDSLYRYNHSIQNLSPLLPNDCGNVFSWDMLQLLNVYEATEDNAYLLQFIHISANSILNRFDVKNNFASQYPPKWTLTNDVDGESTYFNTILTIPMAKFAYLVRNNLQLFATQIPITNIQLISQDVNKLILKYPSTTFVTYGDYADWLGARVEETMKYLDDHYWNDSFGHVKFIGEQNAAELNFQSSFATLYLWMYKINHSFSSNALSHSHIHDRLEILKNKYYALFFHHCISNGIGGSAIESVFNEINSNGNQLFVWSHWGWRDYGCDTRWKEDIAHGATDLWFPITDYQLGQEFFTDNSFFNKFHSTFTENIWESPWKFYNSVYRTDDGLENGNGDNKLNYFYHEILDWMPLYLFDTGNNQVYNDLLTHAYNLKNGNFTASSCDGCTSQNSIYNMGGQGLLGLTEVIKAQWQKECVNLKLYNRKVVYDQDFTVKNRLTIQPKLGDDIYTVGQSSFADPIISTPEFTILSGVTSHIIAGEEIALLDGFSAEEGSNVIMTINPNACSDGNRYELNTDTSTSTHAKNKSNYKVVNQNKHINSLTKQTSTQVTNLTNRAEETSFAMYPNPAQTTLTLLSPNKASIVIIDMIGNIVIRKQSNSSTTELCIQELPNGIYYVQAHTDKDSFIQKFLKE